MSFSIFFPKHLDELFEDVEHPPTIAITIMLVSIYISFRKSSMLILDAVLYSNKFLEFLWI